MIVFYNFIKKSPWHRCFPVNCAKFLRTPFFTEHIRWLLPYISNQQKKQKQKKKKNKHIRLVKSSTRCAYQNWKLMMKFVLSNYKNV